MSNELVKAGNQFLDWFSKFLLPFWFEKGIDGRLGAVHEKLTYLGVTKANSNWRMLSQARFASILAVAQQHDWIHGTQGVVSKIHNFSIRNGTLPDRSNGFVTMISADLTILDAQRGIMEQAAFALSSCDAYESFGAEGELRRAINIARWIRKMFYTQECGWFEDFDRTVVADKDACASLITVFVRLFRVTGKEYWLHLAESVVSHMKGDLSLGGKNFGQSVTDLQWLWALFQLSKVCVNIERSLGKSLRNTLAQCQKRYLIGFESIAEQSFIEHILLVSMSLAFLAEYDEDAQEKAVEVEQLQLHESILASALSDILDYAGGGEQVQREPRSIDVWTILPKELQCLDGLHFISRLALSVQSWVKALPTVEASRRQCQ